MGRCPNCGHGLLAAIRKPTRGSATADETSLWLWLVLGPAVIGVSVLAVIFFPFYTAMFVLAIVIIVLLGGIAKLLLEGW
jgi:ABC-type transport system involved in Fe-S cluster assembly fused permease/ATPase subunit